MTSTPLLSEKDIAKCVKSLADVLRFQTDGKLTLVVVLKAAIVFASDLLRQLPSDARVEFVSVSTYGGGFKAIRAPTVTPLFQHSSLHGENVVILDTVYDSGLTVKAVKDFISTTSDPLTLTTCVLVWKSDSSVAQSHSPDLYAHKANKDDFLVGYGLDVQEEFRGQPTIAIVGKEKT